MLEVLQFVFSSFWVWLGTLILLCTLWNGTAAMVTAIIELLRRK
jgi:hypothetical protein